MLTILALVPTALASTAPLADEIRSLQADVGNALMICVAGEDAEQATRETLREIGQEDVLVSRIPTAGDIEAEVGEGRGDDFGAAVVAVLSHFGDEDSGPAARAGRECVAQDADVVVSFGPFHGP